MEVKKGGILVVEHVAPRTCADRSNIEPIDIRLKKIVAKRIGNSQKQLGIKTLTIEYLINIGSVASECIRQPDSGLLPTSKLITDDFSYKRC